MSVFSTFFKKKKMRARLITGVLMGLVTITTIAQVNSSRPKLVVGIMVDQLRTDYIETLKELLGDKGFKKLMRDGAYFRNIDFAVAQTDVASGTAMVYTGNYPSKNGVSASSVYNPQSMKSESALNDPDAIGNFTTETFSPRNILLSTISDEVKIDGAGLGAVYSVAIDPQQAIIMAGHAGNSAFWINENSGKWCTTTYYKDVPQFLSQRNYKKSLSSRIDTMQWKPTLELDKYIGIPGQKRYYPFRYTFPKSDRNVYRMYLDSPLANEEVTTVAVEHLRTLGLGSRGDAIDMLNIGYTAAPFKYVKDGDYRLELQDTYIKLDTQLGRLFDAIDKYVGLEHTVVFLSSTGYYDDAVKDDDKYGIPSGDFSVKRASSLLNSYLVALHGNGNYIKCYSNNQFYLDHKQIETKGLNPTEIAQEAKIFLCKMSGISEAYTLADILSHTNPDLEPLRLCIDPKTAGDIYIKVAYGWTLTDDSQYPNVVKPIRAGMVLTPAFIMGGGVEQQTINTPVDATILAPTITQILRIRSPNGAVSKPLPL